LWLAVALSAAAAEAWAQPTGDAFDQLPRTETAGRQIGWASDVYEAMVAAVEANKPLVVVFGAKDSSLSQRMAAKVLSCPQINRLAGRAVFVYGPPSEDEFARRMALHLKLTDFPTISVIAPRTDVLTELYRMEGYFDAQTIARDLERLFRERGYWPKDDPGPPPAVAPPYGWSGRECTPESVGAMDPR
jgi:hypothetical protein